MLAGHGTDYRMWKAFGKLGDAPRSSLRWASGSCSYGTHPATSGCRTADAEASGPPAGTWAMPTPHSSIRTVWTAGKDTLQIDSRTGLLQGTRRCHRLYGRDGVVLDADSCAACQYSGAAVRQGDCVVHARQGRARPARGTNQDNGGDCPPRTRVAGTCYTAPSTESEWPGTYKV